MVTKFILIVIKIYMERPNKKNSSIFGIPHLLVLQSARGLKQKFAKKPGAGFQSCPTCKSRWSKSIVS